MSSAVCSCRWEAALRILVLLAPFAGSAQVFGPVRTQTAGADTVSIAVGDVDGRLGPDLLVANRDDGDVMVFRAKGDGTYDVGVVAASVPSPQRLVAMDLANDGDLDLVVTGRNAAAEGTLNVLSNDGSGGFTAASQTTPFHGGDLAVADFDRDGDGDVVVANPPDDNVTVFLGSGATFSVKASLDVGDEPAAVAASDIDVGNGADVVAVHRGGTDGISVCLNLGNADFADAVEYAVSVAGDPAAIAVLDLDGLFGLDLVSANPATGDLSILLSTGNGQYGSATSVPVPTGGGPALLVAGDLDDDANPDVVVGQQAGRASVFLGDGGGGLVPDGGSPYAVPLSPQHLALADLDFDNDLDLAAATTDAADPTLPGMAVRFENLLGPFGPTVATTVLPDGVTGVPYATTLQASGGTPPYTWDLSGTSLPTGLSLDGASGVISGTPVAVGIGYLTVRVTDAGAETGSRPLSLRVLSPASVVVAKGSGPTSSYDQIIEGYGLDGAQIPELSVATFVLTGYGARLGSAELDGDGLAEILATPGPGPTHPTAVRGYDHEGARMPLVDFFAYAVNAYGAASAGADVDALLEDEILTGPGPGAVFGPQVRAFAYDGVTFPSPLGKVSFFAYGTLRYGVNVAGGDVDGDGFVEVLTGPGPGEVFGPHVRGFDYDGAALRAIGTLSFFAYGTLKYGVNVAGAELDGDARAELVTGPGPGFVFGAHLRGFDHAPPVGALPGLSAFVFGSRYGLQVGAGDLQVNGIDDIVTGPGPDPGATARIAAFAYNGSSLTAHPLLNAVDPFPAVRYGLRVTVPVLGY